MLNPFFGSDPFEGERRLFSRMNRLMEQMITESAYAGEPSAAPQSPAPGMTDAVAQQTPTWGFFRTPRLDVIETEDAFVVKADLPGLKKNQVRISLLDGILTIEGERHAEHDESSDTLHMVECSYGQFQRKLRLPPTVDAEKIEARMAEGVLELKIAKKELPPPAVPKKILIQ